MDIFVLQLNKRQSQQYGQCPAAGSNSKVPFVLHYRRDTSSFQWQCLNRGRPLPSAIDICIIVIFILMYTIWRFRTQLRDKYRYFCEPIPFLLLRYFLFLTITFIWIRLDHTNRKYYTDSMHSLTDTFSIRRCLLHFSFFNPRKKSVSNEISNNNCD